MKKLFLIWTKPLVGLDFSLRFFVRFFWSLFYQLIEVENENRLNDSNETFIFTFNHNNSFETVVLATYLLFHRNGRKVHFVVDWVFGYLPIIGWIINLTEPIFVFNKKAKIPFFNHIKNRIATGNVLEVCEKRLKDNHSVAIFPEGKRNQNPNELLHARKGIGHIALSSGAKVLPIGIDFPCRMRFGRIPKLGRIILRIGKPLDFSEEIAKYHEIIKSDELSRKDKQKFLIYYDKKIAHAIMQEISKLSKKNYPFAPPQIPFGAAFLFET